MNYYPCSESPYPCSESPERDSVAISLYLRVL